MCSKLSGVPWSLAHAKHWLRRGNAERRHGDAQRYIRGRRDAGSFSRRAPNCNNRTKTERCATRKIFIYKLLLHFFRDCVSAPLKASVRRETTDKILCGRKKLIGIKKMKTDDKNNVPKVRIAVIGKSNVGKSALTVRYLTRRYIGEYRSNTDLLYRQTLTINNAALDVEIVDVCSCELSLFPEEAIYWADACVIVYDITSRASFTHAGELLQRVQQLRSQMSLILLANKSDLEHLRQVDEIEGRTLAVQNNCQFSEVSVAENSPSIYSSFDMMLNECRSVQATQKTRKFSVSKMIGTLIGNTNGKVVANTNQGGTVVVCHKSDLYKSRVLKRRQNFTATASL